MVTNGDKQKRRSSLAIFRGRINRRSTANTMMFSFIIMTSIGGFIIAPAVGFLIAGASCGLFGFLLGLE